MNAPPHFLFSSTTLPLPRASTTFLHCFLPSSIQIRRNRARRRPFPPPPVASLSNPINVDYLDQRFDGRGHGVTFEAIGDDCIAKLGLQNGASAILMLPSGLITSYKPPMWHGGSLELLHSSVSQDKNGDAVIQGGVSLSFHSQTDGHDVSRSKWALNDITGDPYDSIQVELMSSDPDGLVEFKYLVTLRQDMLTSELVVSNNKQTSLHLMGCVLSHLTVSTPEATYAVGLEGSDFYSRTPFSSNSAIIPPDYGQRSSSGWGPTLKGIISSWGRGNQNNGSSQGDEEEIEGEETENYKQLMEQMSRIYTSAPRNFTIIDRGRRNSVVVGRDGFDELYMFSPGSNHVYYGEYSYICVGQSAILKPIVLGPLQVWRGSQHLYNPNL